MDIFKTNINGKLPFVLNDIRFMDSIYRKAFNAILSGLMKSDGVVYGCKLVVSGNDATIEEGAIWLNGELLHVGKQIFRYDGSHNYFFKLHVYNLPEGKKVFGDNIAHETYEARVGVVHDGGASSSIPGMIKINSSKLMDNAPGRIPRISTTENAQNGLKPKAIVGTSATGALVSCAVKSAHNKDFASKTEVLAGVLDKTISPASLQDHEDWKSVTAASSGWDVSKVLYRKLSNGLIQLVGETLSIGPIRDKLMFTLPEGYRPVREVYIRLFVGNYWAIINTNGEVKTSDIGYGAMLNEIFAT